MDKAAKKTRIFVDCHVFDGNLQGTTTYLKGLYLELVKDQSKQFFLAATNIENLEQIFGSHDNVVYLKYLSKNKFIRLLFDIPKMVRKHDIDYAHFQYIAPPFKNCRQIVTIHDVLFLDFPEYFPKLYKFKNHFLFKRSAKQAAIVLTVSQYSKERIQKHFHIEKVTITPNAVDPAFFEPYDKAEAIQKAKHKYGVENYWVYTSRREPRKNHDRLLRVFVENGHYKNHHLVFIGDKAIKNEAYDRYFESLSEAQKTKIVALHKVNFEDLLLLIRGASLSVYPSIAEGFGIPPLESAAANIPTICSNSTAMSDFDFFGNALFDPLSETDLSQKIEKGFANENLAQKSKAIAAKYTWAAAMANFNQALSEAES